MCGASDNRAAQVSLTLTLSKRRAREIGKRGIGKRSGTLCSALGDAKKDAAGEVGWQGWGLMRALKIAPTSHRTRALCISDCGADSTRACAHEILRCAQDDSKTGAPGCGKDCA